MAGISQVKTAGRYNRRWIKPDQNHVLRRLLSNLETQEDGIDSSREAQMVPMHQASAEQARENQKFLLNFASPEEGHTTATTTSASPDSGHTTGLIGSLPVAIPAIPAAQSASQSTIASQSTLSPASKTLPPLTTPTAIPIASIKTTMTAPSVSTTSSSQSPCSGGASCFTSTSNLHPTATAKPIDASQRSASSSGSNSGMIFIGFLAGIAILAITIATLSYAVKRWCNRKQRGRIDNDTWRFLEQTPKNFEYPFFGFQNKPSESERIIGSSDEKCISSFLENKGCSWVIPEVPTKSHQSAWMGPYQPYTLEHSGTYSAEVTLPQVTQPESFHNAANFYNNTTSTTAFSPPNQLPTAPARAFNRPASAFV